MAVKYIQQFTLLTFLVQLIDPAIGQPPLGYLTFPFLYPEIFWFGINMGMLLLLDELEDHVGWPPIVIVYFLGALVGNLGLLLGGTAFGMAGGSAGVLALCHTAPLQSADRVVRERVKDQTEDDRCRKKDLVAPGTFQSRTLRQRARNSSGLVHLSHAVLGCAASGVEL